MSLNPVIFEDADGMGVQVGEEKVYLTEEISEQLGYSFNRMEAEISKFHTQVEQLKYKLLLAESELEKIKYKHSILCKILEDDI